jgi:hypothetical protein
MQEAYGSKCVSESGVLGYRKSICYYDNLACYVNYPANKIFLSNRPFKVSVKGEMTISQQIQALITEGSMLAPPPNSL